MIKSKDFCSDELAAFRSYQRRSFAILEAMAASLQAGQTEKEVAHELVGHYRAAGVTSFFHLPVVLFGERTALPGAWRIGNFFPKSRALQAGDSVIMDAAPLFRGYLVDTSYSFCFAGNPVHQQMMVDLAVFRKQVCTAVNNGDSFKSIADTVASDLRAKGYEPVHTKHPGEVLGHRAVKTVRLPFAWRLQGFDGPSLGWFLLKSKVASLGLRNSSPLWNSQKSSDHPPVDGLWLVEPHAGRGAIGAKWEEILVIQDGHAEWLEPEPPHVRQWEQIANGLDYGPQSPA